MLEKMVETLAYHLQFIGQKRMKAGTKLYLLKSIKHQVFIDMKMIQNFIVLIKLQVEGKRIILKTICHLTNGIK